MQNNLKNYNEVSPRFHRPRGSANEEFERTWTGGESLRSEESSVNSPHVDVEERTPTRTPFGRASTPHSVPHRRPAERRGGPKDAHGQAASVPREKHLGTHPRHRTRERHGRTEASAMADPATGAVTAPITIKIRQQEPAGEHSLTVAGDVRAPDDTTPTARLLPLPPASTTFLFVLLPSRPHGNDRVRV